MIRLKLKQINKLHIPPGKRILVISCEGCREVSYPECDVIAMVNEIAVTGTVIAVTELAYMCSQEHLRLQLQNLDYLIQDFDMILVFSCGVGGQVLRNLVRNVYKEPNIKIIAACNTYPLPGFQGLTPSSYDCALCGDCHLNETGAICPVTACSKGLINGQCGGAKNGKCEVNNTIECGWERIYKRLEQYNATNRAV